jgi:hypothetical protein
VTAQSEQAAVTMAELWGEQMGRFERTAPGFQGAALLREGANLLAISCGVAPFPGRRCRGAGDGSADGGRRRLRRAGVALDRRSWRVPVVDRASGSVARSEWFEDEAAARRRHAELSADAASLDAAAFRSRYRLP